MYKKIARLSDSKPKMNLANRITVLRMLLVPIYVAMMIKFKNTSNESYLQISLGIFIFAAITDALDGLLAKVKKIKTDLGAILDPIADKFLLITAVILLSTHLPLKYHLPSWYAVLVISRDILIIMGIFVIYMLKGKIKIKPSFVSKITTVLQIMTIIWVMISLPRPQIIWYTASLFTLISAFGYIIEGSKKLNA